MKNKTHVPNHQPASKAGNPKPINPSLSFAGDAM